MFSKSIFMRLAAISINLIPSIACASYVSEPEPNSGSLFVLNNVSGVISLCYQIIGGSSTCVVAATFPNVSQSAKILQNGSAIFILDTTSGRIMSCGRTTVIGNGVKVVPSCVMLSSKLP